MDIPGTQKLSLGVYYLVHLTAGIEVMFQRNGALSGGYNIYILLLCAPAYSYMS